MHLNHDNKCVFTTHRTSVITDVVSQELGPPRTRMSRNPTLCALIDKRALARACARLCPALRCADMYVDCGSGVGDGRVDCCLRAVRYILRTRSTLAVKKVDDSKETCICLL